LRRSSETNRVFPVRLDGQPLPLPGRQDLSTWSAAGSPGLSGGVERSQSDGLRVGSRLARLRDCATTENTTGWKERTANAALSSSRAEWRVLFHPCPASFGVYSTLRSPYILESFTSSGFETSRHYLAGVSQNTLPVIYKSSHCGESIHGDFSMAGVAAGFGTMNDQPYIVIGERDGWGDAWKNSTSFGRNNLLVLSLIAARAFEWIGSQPRQPKR
jgi:hypothetical protein